MQNNQPFRLISDTLELGENGTPSNLYARWDTEKVQFITTDLNGSNHNFFESTKHPEKLTEEERHRVLDYVLGHGSYPKDEIVNYNDLFLQGEFITEANIPQNYILENLEY